MMDSCFYIFKSFDNHLIFKDKRAHIKVKLVQI